MNNPVLSLQTLATADLLYAVPLLLGRLHGDEISAAGILGPLGMQVHGKRDVRRPSGLSGGSLSFRELPERTSRALSRGLHVHSIRCSVSDTTSARLSVLCTMLNGVRKRK